MENTKISDSKKWISFGALVLAAGTIYKLGALKNAFYIPMQELMGLTHTQIGNAMSISGIVSQFSFLAAIYLTDRVSKRTLISTSLLGVGALGIWLATFPSYYTFLLIYCLLAICADMLFWPTMLKTVRLLGTKEEQGRMFGFLEAGRGLVDTVVSFVALGIFSALGSGVAGLKAAILFFAGVPFALSIILFFLVKPDPIREVNKDGVKVGKNMAALDGVKRALKNKLIWMVALNVFCVYGMYCGITYFIPFLKEIYALPVILVSSYGIINQYGLKMLGGPVGGFLADKAFHSPTKYMRVAFAVTCVILAVFMFLPHQSINVYAGMIVTLTISACIFSLRAVFFAPMGEIDVPTDITGSAMSLGSFVGYLPGAFMFSVYGNILDKMEGIAGYRTVFTIMIAFGLAGILLTTLLLRVIKKREAA